MDASDRPVPGAIQPAANALAARNFNFDIAQILARDYLAGFRISEPAQGAVTSQSRIPPRIGAARMFLRCVLAAVFLKSLLERRLVILLRRRIYSFLLWLKGNFHQQDNT